MRFNRAKNSKRNIIWGIMYRIVVMIFPFIMRTIVIYSLGALYLGLNSLFSSILNALNLAELGVGSALVFAMYKPVALDDKKQICALLNFYRTAYYLIGTFITVVGLLLVPFLHLFIKGEYPTDVNIYIVYVIQLLSNSIGYFLMAYKGSVLNAYQRNDIISKFSLVTDILGYAGQVIALLVFQNYYIYILILLIRVTVFNLLVSRYVDKHFPTIKAEGKIENRERKTIFIKIGALMGHRISAVIINSVDNVFISMFIGLQMVAIFNNYSYVISAVTAVFMMLVGGLNSIVGNYLVEESKENIKKLFFTIHFLLCAMVCVCCVCFLNLFQTFMQLWTGKDMLLPWSSVILFVIYFFSIRVRTAGQLFQDAAGIWEKTIILSYIIIVVDLVIDIVLLKRIGINGALISTIVSMIIAYIYESVVLFKYVIITSKIRYYINTILYVASTIAACIVSKMLCNMIHITNLYLLIVVQLFVSVCTSVVCFGVITSFRAEMRSGVSLIKKVVRR